MQRSVNPHSVDVVLTLNNLATLEERAGQLSEARRDQSEALRLAALCLAANDPIWARLWNNLGKIALGERKTAEAKKLYEQALRLWLSTEGKSSNYAATLTCLASIEAQKGQRRAAESMYAEALQIDEKMLGENHPRVASDLTNVGIQLLLEHKPGGAIPLFARSAQIQENTFGPKDIRVARAERLIGLAYSRCRELPEAEEAYRKAIDISTSATNNPTELMGWLSEYAQILMSEQKFAEAEQAYVKVNGLRVRNSLRDEGAGGR
jgi:tetratricopeptide (TPR) repeat protein